MVTIPSSTGLIAKIKSGLGKVTPLGVATTTAGIVGTGIALYDAHAHAKLKAYEYKNIKDADSLP